MVTCFFFVASPASLRASECVTTWTCVFMSLCPSPYSWFCISVGSTTTCNGLWPRRKGQCGGETDRRQTDKQTSVFFHFCCARIRIAAGGCAACYGVTVSAELCVHSSFPRSRVPDGCESSKKRRRSRANVAWFQHCIPSNQPVVMSMFFFCFLRCPMRTDSRALPQYCCHLKHAQSVGQESKPSLVVKRVKNNKRTQKISPLTRWRSAVLTTLLVSGLDTRTSSGRRRLNTKAGDSIIPPQRVRQEDGACGKRHAQTMKYIHLQHTYPRRDPVLPQSLRLPKRTNPK